MKAWEAFEKLFPRNDCSEAHLKYVSQHPDQYQVPFSLYFQSEQRGLHETMGNPEKGIPTDVAELPKGDTMPSVVMGGNPAIGSKRDKDPRSLATGDAMSRMDKKRTTDATKEKNASRKKNDTNSKVMAVLTEITAKMSQMERVVESLAGGKRPAVETETVAAEAMEKPMVPKRKYVRRKKSVDADGSSAQQMDVGV